MKFYETDNQLVSQLVFVIQLTVIFGGYIFARPYTQELQIYFEQYTNRLQSLLATNNFDISSLSADLFKMVDAMSVVMLIMIVIKSITFVISLYYGTFYYYSQTQPEMKSSERTAVFFKRLPKIIMFNILFYIVMGLISLSGMIVLVIPIFSGLIMILPIVLLILNTLFIFKDLLIIEFDVNVFRNFKKSLDITKGCRKNVIMNGLWPLCLSLLVSVFAVDVQNPILSLFIASFIEVVFLLIAQRLTVLMFLDAASLERRNKKAKQKV
jgi:hypothetical protein